VDNNTTGAALFNDDIDAARVDNGNTYTWELAVKIFDDSYVYNGSNTPVTLSNNKEMGFSLAYCDNDGSPMRENFIGSKFLEEDESNNSYIDATIFGTLTLIDPKGGSTPVDPPETLSDSYQTAIDIYPNPAQGKVFCSIASEIKTDLRYTVRSTTGHSLLNGILGKDYRNNSIDISTLQPGIYFIEIQGEHQQFVRQILVY
jgi:hypothetical protein